MRNTLLIAMFGIAGALITVGYSSAQVAGSITLGVAVTEMTEIANGWSAKKSILGKTVYNDTGEKIGKVDDLIIAPDKNVSYLIIAAGGFLGMGQHDIAIPITQSREQDDKIVVPGATKEAVRAMPRFEYARDAAERNQFIARSEQDLAKAKEKMAEIPKKSAGVTGEAKAKLDQQFAALQQDIKTPR